MKSIVVVFAICCLNAAQARPGYKEGGGEQLEGVPGLESYGKLTYPKFELIELGEYSKGELPPKTIYSHKEVTIKVPEPYPVKVPHSVPVPVPVAQPYPVVQTKYVKVPHPVPYEVIKKVPYPIEVPKPYPVPSNEHASSSESDLGHSYGGGDLGHQQVGEGSNGGGSESQHQVYKYTSYGVPGAEQGTPLGGEDYSGGSNNYQVSSYESNGGSSYGGGEGHSDQSGGYAALTQQDNGWNGVQGGGGGGGDGHEEENH